MNSACRPILTLVLAMGLAVGLAACGGGDDATDGGAASGEVLEGTISDEMIALEKVKSQPPLLGEDGNSGEDEAEDAE